MIYENWLYIDSLSIKTPYCPTLKEKKECDCLVIGGGFAGLHAALKLSDSGKKVILLEKSICGGSSSGQSGGFLTPESEEDMSQIKKYYGKKKAIIIYKIPLKGVKLIVNIAKKNKFNCDLRKQDSLYFTTKESHIRYIKEEAKFKKKEALHFKLLNKKSLKKVHPGKHYKIALRYPGSYGINSFAYCQEMKNLLLKKGVKIYENTEVMGIEKNTAKTKSASVTAKNIVVCIDKIKTEFHKEFSKKYYHMQTYLAISEPLSKALMKSIFPKGELMCWDANLVYIHYRPIKGNRIIIGGSSPWTTYNPKANPSPRIIESFIRELKTNFPELKETKYTHYWSGMLDVTKDLVPIVDYDGENKSIQYVMGCAGLNWATYAGDYAARRVVSPKLTEDLSEFTKMGRKFYFSDTFQKIFGKRITFALSHLKQLLG